MKFELIEHALSIIPDEKIASSNAHSAEEEISLLWPGSPALFGSMPAN